MERSESLNRSDPNGNFGFGAASDRRFAFSRQVSFQQSQEPHTPVSIDLNDSSRPLLSRNFSGIDIPPGVYWSEENQKFFNEPKEKFSLLLFVLSVFKNIRYGSRYTKRLFVLISLNVAYSSAELLIGLFTGRVGLVSDAFHLTFGCGLLTFSLFVMAASRQKADRVYTYGYKRLEVLSAFTNALFLLFLSFSLAVEALHAFIQDESEHRHYLIISAVTNLFVNLIGVWFFRNYARVSLSYRNAEDMNYHSVCLHVLADSIRSAGLILASWFLSIGYAILNNDFQQWRSLYDSSHLSILCRVQNAEVLCLGLVSFAVFMLVLPLFKATGGILLQMAPPSIPTSALSKCLRQIGAREDVLEVSQSRFWELVPGESVSSLSIQVKKGTSDRSILEFVHGLYHDLGILDLTVQIDDA